MIYKFIIMKKERLKFLFIIGLNTILLYTFYGCAMFRGPEYSEIIYNYRQPLISVTYEYGEIALKMPLEYPGAKPENLLFNIYSRGDTSRTMISILQDASKEFRAYLPQGVLDTDNETNLIKIYPQDPDFTPQYIPFKGIQFGELNLPTAEIVMIPLTIEGTISLNRNDSILEGVSVAIQNFDQTIIETESDTAGYFKLIIPGEYKREEYIQLVAGMNMIFKPFKQKLDFSNSYNININIGMGPSANLAEPLYLTNKSNVHFRDNPDIGSSTLFLLENGETFSVQRVTPGEYFGSIEVDIGKKGSIKLDGWVYRSDLDLLQLSNLFKKQSNDVSIY